MKRPLAILCALALFLALAACGAGGPEAAPTPEPTAAAAPTPSPTPEPTPEPTPDRAPVLTPGAETESVLSAPFQTDAEGFLFTGVASGSGLNYLNSFLADAAEYISSFLYADDGVYAAGKDGFYSLEPSALRFYPKEGDAALLTDDLSADGRFVLAGPYIFYRSYYDSDLVRIDLADNTSEIAAEGIGSLLAASEGFIYYSRADGVYRNDSTMTAEVKLFDTNVSYLCADPAGLCDLTFEDEGATAILEFREPDGALTARASLPELADNMYCRDGRVYVPQAGMGNIEVFDIAAHELLDPIVLTQRKYGYVIVQYVSDEAIYYETVIDGYFPICRTPLTGGEAEIAGYIIL